MKAFPWHEGFEKEAGMDLRDYFAAKIVITLIPNNTDPQMIPYVCEASYKWADAMMEARSK
jgi:hypothetical protein